MLVNLALMLIAFIAFVYIALLFVDVFTSHGQERKVPDVRNMPLAQAISVLEDAGFKWDISDSTNYDESHRPGMVLDQDPQANSQVKAIRTIYLKVNAMHARIVSFPKIHEVSIRQGLATLRAIGFKNIEVDSVASPYKGLILQVKVNGRQIAPNTNVSINSMIRLTVGDGSIEDMAPDSILDYATIDSIEEMNYMQELERLEKEAEENAAKEAASADNVDKDKKDSGNKDKDRKSSDKDKDKKKDDNKARDNKDKEKK